MLSEDKEVKKALFNLLGEDYSMCDCLWETCVN